MGLAWVWFNTSLIFPSGPGLPRKTRHTSPCAMFCPSWVSKATSETCPAMAAPGAGLVSGAERGTTVVLGGTETIGGVATGLGTMRGADTGGDCGVDELVSVCQGARSCCWAR